MLRLMRQLCVQSHRQRHSSQATAATANQHVQVGLDMRFKLSVTEVHDPLYPHRLLKLLYACVEWSRRVLQGSNVPTFLDLRHPFVKLVVHKVLHGGCIAIMKAAHAHVKCHY